MRRAALCGLFLFVLACGEDPSPHPTPSACGPAPGGEEPALAPLPPGTGLVVTTALDYGSATLDSFTLDEPRAVTRERLLLSGAPVVRPLGDQAAVLIRSSGSSLLVVQGDLSPGLQVSLGNCNPHDVELLDGCRALVTCFERTEMAVIDLVSGVVTPGPDLSALADADGRPEMDHMVRLGDRIYVSLELLEPDFNPSGAGVVAVVDATSLELVDVDEASPGVQGFAVCMNPFTDLAVSPDEQLVVGCLGRLGEPATAAVVALDPAAGVLTTLATGVELGGVPSALRLDDLGVPYVLHWGPNALDPTEMRLVRLEDSLVVPVYTSPIVAAGDQGLAGLDIGSDGLLYVGNRSAGADAGVWVVDPESLQATGPLRTSLPPFEIEVF